MHVPRFWEKESTTATAPNGRSVAAGCWGWSEHSPEEARSRAAASAKRLVARLLGDGDLPSHYGYDERLPREEIVDEFTDADGQTQAIVTRNAYGSLILNTRDLMFIDVDFPPSRPQPLPGFLMKLLGQPAPQDPEASVGEKIRSAARNNRGLGFRIYRTKNGFRVMVLSRPIRAESDESRRLLDAFDADPLYRRMCKNQDCFRARLTPKAWRCHLSSPPARFPFADASQQAAQRDWEKNYLSAISNYSTCQYIETIGNDVPDPELVGLVELHDKLSKASSSDPLA